MITKPQLPPRAGYVEIELPDGSRAYQPTKAQKEKEALAEENKLLKAQVQALTDRNEFMEDCIAEMATQVYA